MDYVKATWQKLAEVFPREHVASRDSLQFSVYQVAEDSFVLVLELPNADRMMEVKLVGIVYQPTRIDYFGLGRGSPPGPSLSGIELWTLRYVTPQGHKRCGSATTSDREEFVTEVCASLGVASNVRPAADADFRRIQPQLPTFPSELHVDKVSAWELGAIYSVLSESCGDTSSIPVQAAIAFYDKHIDKMRPLVEKKLRELGATLYRDVAVN